jgi:type I site-specific restriction endonuclease
MNEAETRAEHIDPALKAAGWGVIEGSKILREYRITQGRLEGRGRRGNPEIADYVLVYRATQDHALAVRDLINQMKTSKDPNYCQRVTANDGDLGEQHLRDFQDNEKTIPTVLFGRLPEFFRNEAELRALWSAPETRKKLLQGLAEKGFGGEQLAEMQKIIDAEKSDLFDVLAHVAYALPPLTREERAVKAKVVISTHFNSKQQVFLDFVLSHYVSVGVEELDQDKLTPLLRLKYHNSIADAVADLGRPDEIGRVFAGFQKYLYQQQAAA